MRSASALALAALISLPSPILGGQEVKDTQQNLDSKKGSSKNTAPPRASDCKPPILHRTQISGPDNGCHNTNPPTIGTPMPQFSSKRSRRFLPVLCIGLC